MHKPPLLAIGMILFNVMLTSVGQIVLKLGTSRLGDLRPGHSMIGALTSAMKAMFTPYILTGLFIYAMSAVVWIVILNQVRLSFAYPMISLSYVLIVILSAVILGEKVPPITIGGLLLICAGVSLIGLGYGSQQ